jgi:hypothetical protein
MALVETGIWAKWERFILGETGAAPLYVRNISAIPVHLVHDVYARDEDEDSV